MDEKGDGRSPYKIQQQQQQQQSWWRRRTHLEKVLLALFGIALILLIITVVAAAASHRAGRTPTPKICLTEQCVKTAARILDSIDPTVDPCDNFYEYACAKWNRDHPIHEERTKSDVFSLLFEKLQDTMRSLLEAPESPSDIPVTRNAKLLYQSCINLTAVEEAEDDFIRKYSASAGGCPVTDANWTAMEFDLTKLLTRMRLQTGGTPFIVTHVAADERNSHVNVIQIDQPSSFPMGNREYYLKGRDDQIVTKYRQFAEKVARHLGATEDAAREQMAEMVDFEIELANITDSMAARRATKEEQYSKITIGQMSKLTPVINWVKFYADVFREVGVDVRPEEPIIVRSSDYITRLGELLNKTSSRVLQNYAIWWTLAMGGYDMLSPKYQVLRKEYTKAATGTEPDATRWRTCVTMLNTNLHEAVGRLYVDHRYFSPDSRKNAMYMVSLVRQAFSDMFSEVPWLAAETKKFAQEKNSAIEERIGYPDYILNNKKLEGEFGEIHFNSGTLFTNLHNLSRLRNLNGLKQLREIPDREKWPSSPVLPNAYYHPIKNAILFPAGILQPPFYHKDNPMYMNFGGIAAIIGHEISHAFDDHGRLYDKDGNVKLWWTPNDIENFVNRTQCFIEQYSSYHISDVNLNINGQQTLGENIADNGGLRQAYRAYTRWVKEHGPEGVLPGIDLNQQQLLFLSFAHNWCGSSRPELKLRQMRSFPHSPRDIRVLGTLSNSDEFAEAYRCPPGSRMNPVKKCRIW